MPLNMKVMLSTNHTVLDVNEKVLRSGKYFFSVEELTKENNVKGKIVHSKSENEDYEFRYFSFLLMTVKAQVCWHVVQKLKILGCQVFRVL